MEKTKDITYSNSITKREIGHTLKTLASYVGIIALWIFVARIYMSFGSIWITFAVSMMWIVGALAVWRIPEERENTLKETKYAILFYIAFLLIYRLVIQKVSGITSGQMSSALNINMSSVDGSTMGRFLQGILTSVSVLTPIGFVIWCGQKLKVFKGRNTRHEELSKLKNFSNDRRSR